MRCATQSVCGSEWSPSLYQLGAPWVSPPQSRPLSSCMKACDAGAAIIASVALSRALLVRVGVRARVGLWS